MKSRVRLNQAFSLIELLVVITIIAILATILTPVALNATGYARQASCAASMKNLASMIEMFTSDNNDYFPGATGSDTGSNRGLWYGQNMKMTSHGMHLLKHLRDFVGPDIPNGTRPDGTNCPGNIRKQQASSSPVYLTNHSVKFDDGTSVDPWGYRNSSRMPQKQTVINGAIPSSAWILEDIDQTLPTVNPSAGWYDQLPATRVHPAFNRVFFDGHVESYK